MEISQLKEGLNKAREALETGEYDIALDYYEEVFPASSSLEIADKVSLLSGKAYCLWRLGYYEEALLFYNRGLEIDPSNFQLHVDKGSVLSEEENWEEALLSFNAALKLDPEHGHEAWVHKAYAEMQLGLREEARKSFLKWINFLKGENAEVQLELHRLWKKLFTLASIEDLEGLHPELLEKIQKKQTLPQEILESLKTQDEL